MTNEQIISDFMRKNYSDQALASLLAHAEDGQLTTRSCCCLVGIPTADHALQGEHADARVTVFKSHYALAHAALDPSTRAEFAFYKLGDGSGDEGRRAKLIPLIKAEMARREELRSESPELTEVTV